MTDRMLVGQKLNSRELRDDDVRRQGVAHLCKTDALHSLPLTVQTWAPE